MKLGPRHPYVLRKWTRKRQRVLNKRVKMWDAMRILRVFTAPDILAVCELTNRRSALTFIGQLRRAGYVANVGGNVGLHEHRRYRLVRNTGPIAPSLIGRGRAIYDHNTDKEYPLERSH